MSGNGEPSWVQLMTAKHNAIQYNTVKSSRSVRLSEIQCSVIPCSKLQYTTQHFFTQLVSNGKIDEVFNLPLESCCAFIPCTVECHTFGLCFGITFFLSHSKSLKTFESKIFDAGQNHRFHLEMDYFRHQMLLKRMCEQSSS